MPRARSAPPSPSPRLGRAVSFFLLAAIAACASPASEPAAPPRDGPPPVIDGGTAGPGAARDAGSDAGAPLSITVFPRVGDPTDDAVKPAGPGLVVMGGGPDVDDAFVWAQATIAGSRAGRAGDVVVLRATGGDAYAPYLHAIAPFHSVQTLLVPSGASKADLAAAAAIVDRAEVVFFAGGDQSDYVAWKGTSLAAAVQGVFDRGGVVGGTSAGAAILGHHVYDARNAGTNNLTSADALVDPFDARATFTHGMFAFPALREVITDTHFEQRDRFGRLAAFMARQHVDGAVTTVPPLVVGVGVDEGAALVVDSSGVARLKRQKTGARAFVAKADAPGALLPGAPLVYPGLMVYRFDDPLDTFDFAKGCGDLRSYAEAVDGSKASPFTPPSPYDAPGTTAPCP